ncbi:glycosyltransferase [Arthrobacter sp. 179]|uniref:glycosyltransferase n=1 Tax=Arthrobacter sp. 179 TaxID=3457734 RepID=UPI004033A553
MTVTMPATKYFLIMWSIAETFGGMTSMCMRRARALSQLANVHAPILCFDMNPNHKELFQSLVDRGYLREEMEVLNVFQYYRSKDILKPSSGPVSQPNLSQLRAAFVDRAEISHESIHDSAGLLYMRVARNSSNSIVYRECFRPDGSTFLLDVSTLDNDNRPTKRSVWLLDKEEMACALFRSASAFYRNWLTELADNSKTTFIFDDKEAATNLRTLELSHAVKLVVIHSSHVVGSRDPVRSAIAPSRAKIFDESWRWDGLVFLTDRQRDDYASRFGLTDNLFVVPNPASPAPRLPPFGHRRANVGIMIGSLLPNKNFSIAIDIIDRVRETIPSIQLEIYGKGPAQASLQNKIDRLSLSQNVKLCGYEHNAAAKYATASFSLLTSRYEGFPLTLIESMGLACPPVSFDIKYGPEAMITDSKSGYLVSIGDVDAAAHRIIGLCRSEKLAGEMGQTAWQESYKFSDQTVLQKWSNVVSQAWSQKRSRHTEGDVSNTVATLKKFEKTRMGDVKLAGQLAWATDKNFLKKGPGVFRLQLENRAEGPAISVPVKVSSTGSSGLEFDGLITQRMLSEASSSQGSSPLTELYLIAVFENVSIRRTLESPSIQAPRWVPITTEAGRAAFSTSAQRL